MSAFANGRIGGGMEKFRQNSGKQRLKDKIGGINENYIKSRLSLKNMQRLENNRLYGHGRKMPML